MNFFLCNILFVRVMHYIYGLFLCSCDYSMILILCQLPHSKVLKNEIFMHSKKVSIESIHYNIIELSDEITKIIIFSE